MSNISANLATVSGTAKASSGQLFGFVAVNRNAAVRYLQIFDSASAPVAGQVPVFQFPIASTGAPTGGPVTVGTLALGSNFFAPGWAFTNGITWGFSTGAGTYTAATASEHDFLAVYA